MSDLPSFAELKERERRREAQGIADIVEGAAGGDYQRFVRGLDALWYDSFTLQRAFRRVARLTTVPGEFQHRVLCYLHSEHGDHLRQEIGDLVLIDAYRRILPPYTGPARRLYRGDGGRNRRRRTYGLSWTTDVEVARSFARGIWRTSDGGSVLVETVAEPDAIVAAPAESEYESLHQGESEYIVDRRRLGRVKLLERFGQLTPQQYSELCRASEQTKAETEKAQG
jgi:hypothetical protein